ncbi:cytokine receptor common subunit gamma-like isoform 2-T2 [Polymixia lowei]
MMPFGLFILLYLTGHLSAKQQPDVDCLLLDLDYVHCTWNGQGTPEVNYTFFNRFFHDPEFSECAAYISENSTIIGCNHPFEDLKSKKFNDFYTKLVYGNNSFEQEHDDLKSKVKLNPPANVTVKNGSDSNLCFYWNTSLGTCAESEVRYRINVNKWEMTKLGAGKQSYCIDVPSNSSLYELQVRSTMGEQCGRSTLWSDWTQPVFWGLRRKNSPEPGRHGSTSVQTLVLYIVGAFTLILLVILLVHHERLRIILIPIVPNPGKNLDEILTHGNVEKWLPISKDLKEGFKANFNERPCSVCEYSCVPQSPSESSDDSTSAVSTDQTNCSISIPANESECLSSSCSSSTSTLPNLSEEGKTVV